MLIEVKDLTHIYMQGTPMEQLALHKVNFTVDTSEFIGVIGHTGSGKSTLVQHLNALLLPSEGHVVIDGKDTLESKEYLREIRQKVGLVFQYPEHQLFEETVFQDVAFGPKNLGVTGEQLTDRVKESLEFVGLLFEEVKDRSPFELSGGQMRRVAIAGVLAMKPEVLVLDEPTAGLDPHGKKQILDQINKLHEELNLSIILVTHSMEDVARLADRLVVLSEGEITLEGTPEDVFRNGAEIQDLGLDLPQVTALMHRLRSQGLQVPTDVFTVERAKEVLLPYLNGKRDYHV